MPSTDPLIGHTLFTRDDASAVCSSKIKLLPATSAHALECQQFDQTGARQYVALNEAYAEILHRGQLAERLISWSRRVRAIILGSDLSLKGGSGLVTASVEFASKND